ncbi:hypothetical protein PRZ48_014548 [Zasmidium cellare]|uniref:USP domain-containing protein n=1 Tax=Zasmidium cellare TaxID=395010 RepID=A0ABR0DYK7_ZASCE|nr:hypothetical protein PRZ48_014548 [Zasmidium cellare]
MAHNPEAFGILHEALGNFVAGYIAPPQPLQDEGSVGRFTQFAGYHDDPRQSAQLWFQLRRLRKQLDDGENPPLDEIDDFVKMITDPGNGARFWLFAQTQIHEIRPGQSEGSILSKPEVIQRMVNASLGYIIDPYNGIIEEDIGRFLARTITSLFWGLTFNQLKSSPQHLRVLIARAFSGIFEASGAAEEIPSNLKELAEQSQQRSHVKSGQLFTAGGGGGGQKKTFKKSAQFHPASKPEDEARPTVTGLVNHGNTCYMNSGFQLLISSKVIRHTLHQLSEALDLTEPILGRPIVNTLIAVQKMQFDHSKNHLRSFIRSLRDNSLQHGAGIRLFTGYTQEDPQEFLSELVDERVPRLLTDAWCHQLISSYTCTSCGVQKTSEDVHVLPGIFYQLAVPQTGSVELSSLLNNDLVKAEAVWVDCGNESCEAHDTPTLHAKHIELQPSEELVIQLQRWVDADQKVGSQIMLPLWFFPIAGSISLWYIKAFVHHWGDNPHWGHYIAVRRTAEGLVLLDDSKLTIRDLLQLQRYGEGIYICLLERLPSDKIHELLSSRLPAIPEAATGIKTAFVNALEKGQSMEEAIAPSSPLFAEAVNFAVQWFAEFGADLHGTVQYVANQYTVPQPGDDVEMADLHDNSSDRMAIFGLHAFTRLRHDQFPTRSDELSLGVFLRNNLRSRLETVLDSMNLEQFGSDVDMAEVFYNRFTCTDGGDFYWSILAERYIATRIEDQEVEARKQCDAEVSEQVAAVEQQRKKAEEEQQRRQEEERRAAALTFFDALAAIEADEGDREVLLRFRSRLAEVFDFEMDSQGQGAGGNAPVHSPEEHHAQGDQDQANFEDGDEAATVQAQASPGDQMGHQMDHDGVQPSHDPLQAVENLLESLDVGSVEGFMRRLDQLQHTIHPAIAAKLQHERGPPRTPAELTRPTQREGWSDPGLTYDDVIHQRPSTGYDHEDDEDQSQNPSTQEDEMGLSQPHATHSMSPHSLDFSHPPLPPGFSASQLQRQHNDSSPSEEQTPTLKPQPLQGESDPFDEVSLNPRAGHPGGLPVHTRQPRLLPDEVNPFEVRDIASGRPPAAHFTYVSTQTTSTEASDIDDSDVQSQSEGLQQPETQIDPNRLSILHRPPQQSPGRARLPDSTHGTPLSHRTRPQLPQLDTSLANHPPGPRPPLTPSKRDRPVDEDRFSPPKKRTTPGGSHVSSDADATWSPGFLQLPAISPMSLTKRDREEDSGRTSPPKRRTPQKTSASALPPTSSNLRPQQPPPTYNPKAGRAKASKSDDTHTMDLGPVQATAPKAPRLRRASRSRNDDPYRLPSSPPPPASEESVEDDRGDLDRGDLETTTPRVTQPRSDATTSSRPPGSAVPPRRASRSSAYQNNTMAPRDAISRLDRFRRKSSELLQAFKGREKPDNSRTSSTTSQASDPTTQPAHESEDSAIYDFPQSPPATEPSHPRPQNESISVYDLPQSTPAITVQDTDSGRREDYQDNMLEEGFINSKGYKRVTEEKKKRKEKRERLEAKGKRPIFDSQNQYIETQPSQNAPPTTPHQPNRPQPERPRSADKQRTQSTPPAPTEKPISRHKSLSSLRDNASKLLNKFNLFDQEIIDVARRRRPRESRE